MNYETVISNIKAGHTVTIVHVNEVVDWLLESYEDDEEQNWERLNELMEIMTVADIQTYNGSSDHYHNLAVSFARANQYGFACDVLRIGLEFYGESQDLLADFLAYADQCNRMDEAEVFFRKLMSMERKHWNWRAFDFSIDYLSVKLLRTSNNMEKQNINHRIDELLGEYRNYHSLDEKAYLAQYIVSTSRNEKDAVKKLQEKIEKNEFPAPRCTLKLAEHFFETGRYEEAEKYINRCKLLATTTERAVEPGSIYTLSALCGMCRIYADGISVLQEQGMLEQRVGRVYKDCAAAQAIYYKRRFREYRELEVQREVLGRLSGIEYAEE